MWLTKNKSMKAAAPKTYISRRMLERYSEQRRIQQESQSSANSANKAPVVPAKTFAEDADSATNIGA